MLDVQHNEDIAKCKQLEVDIEQQEEQHSLTISKLKDSYEVEIWKLQNELNEVKANYDALNEVMTGRGKSAELGGEVNEVKDKVAELEQKMEAETTRQAELVAFGNRLDEMEHRLVAEADALKAGRESVKGEWVELDNEKSRHAFHVRAVEQRYTDWQRAIDTAKHDRDVAREDANDLRYKLTLENVRAVQLKMKLASYDACCNTEHCIEAFVEKRIRECTYFLECSVHLLSCSVTLCCWFYKQT
ncbi:hypothetical protein PF008_g23269 [Phytophthora fragariae]|uniref:Uncharacterized protein n=1 Tax=Phytophthora fragariae TaxID=53985 RepID=A0A6G0QRB4_9STRA|nr:hypothetical protein PF008_g23269 [Phytophthora fragariae]